MSAHELDALKEDLLAVISKYLEIDEGGPEVNLERDGQSVGLGGHIPIGAWPAPARAGTVRLAEFDRERGQSVPTMDRKLWRNFDFILLAAVAALFLFGLVAVYSATRGFTPSSPFYFVIRQTVAALIGLAGLIFVLRIDYRHLIRLARLPYFGTLLLLAGGVLMGRVGGGAERWIGVGSFSLQPAELAKISLILMLAAVLAEGDDVKQWRGVIRALVYTAVPVVLVLLQPDLGTAITLLGITLGMLFFAGARLRHLFTFVTLGLAGVIGAVVASINGWLPLLKPYQVNRLIVFLDPYRYQHDEGWNVIQSMIAIGSGSFFGKGLFGGSQTQLNFLPARHTDFIFSVIGEEFGFVGGLARVVAVRRRLLARRTHFAARPKTEKAA